LRIVGDIDAETKSIARFASLGASCIATNTISAKTTQAFSSARAWSAQNLEPRASSAIAAAIAIAIGTFITGIGAIGDIRARPVASARQSTRTTFAKLIADVVATISIHAMTAQAIRGLSAQHSIETFANARAIATIRIVARHRPGRIDYVIGNKRASSRISRDIARSAGIVAGRIATNAIRTKPARAIRSSSTGLAIVAFARAHSVARIGPGANRGIIATGSDIRTQAQRATDIARFALVGAGAFATYAIGAIAAQAFIGRVATRPTCFETVANGVTQRITVGAARSIRHLGRIGWIAHHVATIDGALFVVHRHVLRIDDRDDIAHTVALQNLAIAGRLLSHGQRHSRSAISNETFAHGAREGRASIVRPAISIFRTADALSLSVARQYAATRNTISFIRIRWNAIRAHIVSARIQVIRKIGVIDLLLRHPHRTTDRFLAITVFRRNFFARQIIDDAGIVYASALLTGAHGNGAMNGRRTLDALLPHFITKSRLVIRIDTRCPRIGRRLHGHSAHAHARRARIAIIRQIRIISDCCARTIDANLLFAITWNRIEIRRGQTI
jgi:hypothetical protein